MFFKFLLLIKTQAKRWNAIRFLKRNLQRLFNEILRDELEVTYLQMIFP